mmetsp:Transcript_96997/g.301937  ORF Transcript_96997/g.301937 Transcript_96997/m.301937 type:complete len:215 (-) Transcript_96997:732-1376(-)
MQDFEQHEGLRARLRRQLCAQREGRERLRPRPLRGILPGRGGRMCRRPWVPGPGHACTNRCAAGEGRTEGAHGTGQAGVGLLPPLSARQLQRRHPLREARQLPGRSLAVDPAHVRAPLRREAQRALAERGALHRQGPAHVPNEARRVARPGRLLDSLRAHALEGSSAGQDEVDEPPEGEDVGAGLGRGGMLEYELRGHPPQAAPQRLGVLRQQP